MKLSMWILNAWLSDFNPTAVIVEGRQSIEGVRLFSDAETQDNRYVYISLMSEFFPNAASEEVLLTHNNDVISLLKGDMETILASINKAFEYYAQWEQSLQNAAMSDTPEQNIVDACADVFGPLFIMDLNFNLMAYSKNYGKGEVNALWDDYILQDNPSLQATNLMKSGSFAKLLPYRHNLRVFREHMAAPYSYNLMVSYLSDDVLVGQLIISSQDELQQHSIQLARSVEKALSSIHKKQSFGSAQSLLENLLTNLIRGTSSETQEHEKLLFFQGWVLPSTFCIINCMPQSTRAEYLRMYKMRLSAAVPDTIMVSHEGSLFGLLRCTSDEIVRKSYTAIAKETRISMGISYIFSEIRDIPLYAKQASLAAHMGREGNRAVTMFQSCALHAITHTNDQRFIQNSLHPLVRALVNIDAENATVYAPTLRCFLQNERSYQLTAQTLFVHRNTVLYRIQKIQEFSPTLNLDDPYEREYLLASFRMLD